MRINCGIAVFITYLMIGIVVRCEPDYCKRGAKISDAYQQCFIEARFLHPYTPISGQMDILDGCVVQAYANHTCSVVKPAALDCFRRNLTFCDQRDRLEYLADESGGACYGSHINREFQEHILDHLKPIRGDSKCLTTLSAYECYNQASTEMSQNNPNLQLLTVEEFMPVVNQFFDSIYNCFIAVYKSNKPLCKNWQIPLLLELQETALPSLFGMHFTPRQMDRLQLVKGCSTHHRYGERPRKRQCVQKSGSSSNSSNNNNNNNNNKPPFVQQQQQKQEQETLPPVRQPTRRPQRVGSRSRPRQRPH